MTGDNVHKFICKEHARLEVHGGTHEMEYIYQHFKKEMISFKNQHEHQQKS